MKTKVAAAAVLTTLAITATAVPASARPAPKACIRALERAETMMDYAIQGFTITSEMFTAASEFDTATLTSLTDDLNALAPQVRIARNAYDKSAAACRRG